MRRRGFIARMIGLGAAAVVVGRTGKVDGPPVTGSGVVDVPARALPRDPDSVYYGPGHIIGYAMHDCEAYEPLIVKLAGSSLAARHRSGPPGGVFMQFNKKGR